jgi:hypothetical protein
VLAGFIGPCEHRVLLSQAEMWAIWVIHYETV